MAPRTSKRQRSQRDRDITERRRTISAFHDDDELLDRRSYFKLSSLNSTKLMIAGLIILGIATFVYPSSLFGSAKSQITQLDDGRVGDALPHVTNDGKYHGRYPNSLLTLFYPFTLLSDVVLDQPVNRTDVPFFWHAHVSVSSCCFINKCSHAWN